MKLVPGGTHTGKACERVVKTTDWFGWTDIISIRRHENIEKWISVQAANQRIELTNETLIPVYDYNNPSIGFHGERKYPYTIKQVKDVLPSDSVQIRRGKDYKNMDIKFTPITILKCVDKSYRYGYEIITKSGFFNANNIHIYGKDVIPESACVNCNPLNASQCEKCYI
jgi:hypothetical protein